MSIAISVPQYIFMNIKCFPLVPSHITQILRSVKKQRISFGFSFSSDFEFFESIFSDH